MFSIDDFKNFSSSDWIKYIFSFLLFVWGLWGIANSTLGYAFGSLFVGLMLLQSMREDILRRRIKKLEEALLKQNPKPVFTELASAGHEFAPAKDK